MTEWLKICTHKDRARVTDDHIAMAAHVAYTPMSVRHVPSRPMPTVCNLTGVWSVRNGDIYASKRGDHHVQGTAEGRARTLRPRFARPCRERRHHPRSSHCRQALMSRRWLFLGPIIKQSNSGTIIEQSTSHLSHSPIPLGFGNQINQNPGIVPGNGTHCGLTR